MGKDAIVWHEFSPRGDGVSNCKLCHQEQSEHKTAAEVKLQQMQIYALEANGTDEENFHLRRQLNASEAKVRTLREALENYRGCHRSCNPPWDKCDFCIAAEAALTAAKEPIQSLQLPKEFEKFVNRRGDIGPEPED